MNLLPLRIQHHLLPGVLRGEELFHHPNYANMIMKECGLVLDMTIVPSSIKRRTHWWKMYGQAVNKQEIRIVQSAKNMHVRDLVHQGKFGSDCNTFVDGNLC